MQEHDHHHHRPLELVAAFGSLRDCNKFGAFSVLFRFPRRRCWSSSGRGHFNLWICYCPTSALKTNLRVVPIHRDSRYVSQSAAGWTEPTTVEIFCNRYVPCSCCCGYMVISSSSKQDEEEDEEINKVLARWIISYLALSLIPSKLIRVPRKEYCRLIIIVIIVILSPHSLHQWQ